MVWFARRPANTVHTVDDICADTGAGRNYLIKIMARLPGVQSRKGHGGGFFQTSPPEVVTAFDVIQAQAPETVPHACLYNAQDCGSPEDERCCRQVYARACAARAKVLRGVTIAQAVEDYDALCGNAKGKIRKRKAA